MDELVKAVSRFLYRDALFILGGSSVILSILYLLDSLPQKEPPVPVYLLGAGFAYVVGYMIQDSFSILRLVTTADYFKPNPFLEKVVGRFEFRKWETIEKFDRDAVRFEIDAHASADAKARDQRTVSLMQIGTTIGPCWLVSFAFLFLRAVRTGTAFDWVLAIAVAISSALLILLGWLKAAQRMSHRHRLNNELLRRAIKPTEKSHG